MATEPSETQGYDALAPSQALGSRTKKKRNNRKKGPPSNNGTAEAATYEEGISDPPAAAAASNKKPPPQNRRKGNETRGGNTQPEVDLLGQMPTAPATGDPSMSSASQQTSLQAQGPKKNAKLRNRRGPKNPINHERGAVEAIDESVSDQPKQHQLQLLRTQPKKKKNNRKRYPWRKFVPSGTVDPITLESLISLEYPPFALMANAPYDPVPVWPIPEESGDSEQQSLLQPPTIDIEELNRRRIAEQWGTRLGGEGGGGETEASKTSTEQMAADPSKRHYNLYDGRALAYYIVSQLQFIDPLNRRDLTRPELLNLDVYLRRHGFQDLNVTDAYDAKGVTISSAGAVATTAQGRADIMQQLARNLLNSLFGGQSVSATPRPTQSSSLQQQYAALQIQEQQQQQQRPRQQGRNDRQQQQQRPQQPGYSTLNPEAASFDGGFYYSEDGGIIVIDDDENLGMRGGLLSASRGNNQSNGIAGQGSSTNPFYSASHITARYGSGFVSGSSADAFPELPTPAAARTNQTAESADQTAKGGQTTARSAPPKPSKTLARITGAVKKTSPEEELKQWKAREEARKRAMMGTMSSGVNTAAIGSVQQSVLMPPPGLSTGLSTADVSDEKLQRNKAFADALGVKPATLRQNLNSGWARPTGTSITLDEFGNELNAVIYPDALLTQARDRMGLVLKVEKKWKAFLVDDKAASLPLYPMDRATRIFVHHYSDFWNLKTESFDPEPRRYIHCVKLPETHMPRPLLSDAAREWRGPSAVPTVSLADLPRGPSASLANSQQTAGEPSKSREIPPPPERVPLPLQPRTLALGEHKEDIGSLGVLDVNEHDGDILASGRFTSLAEGRERPKIALAKRTVPLELPPFQPRTIESNSEAEIQQRRARLTEIERRKKEAEERKRRALEDVFASDDEDDDTADAASTGSAWEEPEAVYQGSDSDD